jgi:hypothetical protein
LFQLNAGSYKAAPKRRKAVARSISPIWGCAIQGIISTTFAHAAEM